MHHWCDGPEDGCRVVKRKPASVPPRKCFVFTLTTKRSPMISGAIVHSLRRADEHRVVAIVPDRLEMVRTLLDRPMSVARTPRQSHVDGAPRRAHHGVGSVAVDREMVSGG
jgi:hypothetical protein